MENVERQVHIRQLLPFLRGGHPLEMKRNAPSRGWTDVYVLRYNSHSNIARVWDAAANAETQADVQLLRPPQPRARPTMALLFDSENVDICLKVLFYKYCFYRLDVWTGYELECRVEGIWREAMVIAREPANETAIVVYIYDSQIMMDVTLGDLRPIPIHLHPCIQALRRSPNMADVWYDARVVVGTDGQHVVQENDGQYYADVMLLETGEVIHVPLENLRLTKKWKRGHWVMYGQPVILPGPLVQEVFSDEEPEDEDDDGNDDNDGNDGDDDDDGNDDDDDDDGDDGDDGYEGYYESTTSGSEHAEDMEHDAEDSDDSEAGYSDFIADYISDRYISDDPSDSDEKRTTVTKPSSDAKPEASAPMSNNASGNAREERNDLIGLAQTGYGKTGAFALPIINALFDAPQAFFACVLSPTRELAIQIAEQFGALGSSVGVKCALLVGGVDMMQQTISLAKRPHIVVEALSKYSTVDTLMQQVHTVPAKYKDCFLVFILTEKPRTTSMVFTRTCEATRLLPISGRMSQGTVYFSGFVEFEESSSAIKASSVTMGGQQVFMMKKRTTKAVTFKVD